MLMNIVMAIPFAILRHVRLSRKQRVVLYSLFSLVVLTMGVIITRLVIAIRARLKMGLTVALVIFLADVEANTGALLHFSPLARSP
jgi:hypothetical protein